MSAAAVPPPANEPGLFKTIVAGCDGHRGRGGAALAQVIAHATGARLLLLGVEYDLPFPLPIETHAEQRAELTEALHDVRDRLAPDAMTQIAVDASPAHALRRVAKDKHADLIVVGARQRTQLQRLTASDRAMQVLHGAPCAVAVAPDRLAPCTRLMRIGVGLDGSPESGAALGMALELAALTGAALRLLAVASDVYPGTGNLVAGPSYPDIYRQVIDARLHLAHATADAALQQCAGVPASADVQLGDTVAQLIEMSTDCDLLVLGSRRWGPLRRLALGSTSERVIRQAACPVLVPPRGAADEHDEPTVVSTTSTDDEPVDHAARSEVNAL